jgi:hypothetical protein
MKQVYNFGVDVGGENVEVVIKRPNHIEIEDAEFVFSQKFNQLLNAGFLSRSMMNKKYGDIGGVYSEKMIKELSIAVEKLADCERTIQFFGSSEDLTNEQREELAVAKDVYTNIQYNIANMDHDLEVMYANSADAKAEEHMIKWFVLNLSFYEETLGSGEDEKKELFPLFEGKTFNEKIESYSEFLNDVEDSDDEELSRKKKVVSESLTKISQAINLWYNGMGDTKEILEENYQKFFVENPPVEDLSETVKGDEVKVEGETEDKIEEVEKKVKKKTTAKKVAVEEDE